jgi:hypothetical protein
MSSRRYTKRLVRSEFLFFPLGVQEVKGLTQFRYEAEIARLRRELEARGGAGVTEPPEGSKPSGEFERPSMYPPALGAPTLNGESGESKLIRDWGY